MTTPTFDEIHLAADRHLGRLFPLVVADVLTENEDGDEVQCLVFNGTFELSPFKVMECRRVLGGQVYTPITRWLVEKMVEDSDPSVGMFGVEAVEWKRFDDPWSALAAIGAELARMQIEDGLEADVEAARLRDEKADADMERFLEEGVI